VEDIVTYIRVSTAKQSDSGLGLDGQRTAIRSYCSATGSQISKEFVEVESGKKNDRVVLRDALAYAKRTSARLVIGKLDRLARNVAFIANLMESNVEVVALDVPGANRLLLRVMGRSPKPKGARSQNEPSLHCRKRSRAA